MCTTIWFIFASFNVGGLAQVLNPEVDCRAGETCIKLPPNCVNSRDCYLFVSYKYDPSTQIFHFTQTTNETWASFAVIPDRPHDMNGIRGEACYLVNSNITLKSLNASGNIQPKFVDAVQGINLLEAYRTNGGSIVCKYTRTASVPAASMYYMYDLREPHYTMYAFGRTLAPNSFPGIHKPYPERGHSREPVVFVEQMNPEVECKADETCIKLPPDCMNSRDCFLFISYKYDHFKKLFHFTQTTNETWVSFAVVPDRPHDMNGIRGEACYLVHSSITLKSLNASANIQPKFVDAVQGINLLETYRTNGGSIVCKYTRTAAVPAASMYYMYDLREPHYTMYAFGRTLAPNSFPGIHKPYPERGHSREPVVFVEQMNPEVECKADETCIKLPPDCMNSRDCFLFISYKYDHSKKLFHFTQTTNETWVSFAVVPDRPHDMNGIRGEACYLVHSSITLKSLNASGNIQPKFVDAVKGITLLETYRTNGGSIVCKYTRTAAVPAVSMYYMYDLRQPHYTMYAFGRKLARNSFPAAHEPKPERGHSKEPVVFVPEMEDLCGKTIGCFRVPRGCSDAIDCSGFAKYKYNKNDATVQFELITNHNWVALGQKRIADTGSKMVKLRGQYCIRVSSNPSFGNFHGNNLAGNGNPEWIKNVRGVVFMEGGVQSDNTLLCRFKRPVVTDLSNSDLLHNLNETLLAVMAYGDGILPNGIPQQHGVRDYGSAEIDFLEFEDTESKATGLPRKVIAHGILMLLAWMLLATIGTFVPRYMKETFKNKKICQVDAWFAIHRLMMVSCVLLLVIALIIILIHLDWKWQEENNRHHILGLITVLFGLIQPLVALFRPKPDSERRLPFNWFHRIFGFVTWVLAGCSYTTGLNFYELQIRPAIVFIVAVVALCIILEIVLVVKRRSPSQFDVAYDMDEGEAIADTPFAGSSKGDRSQDTKLPWLFFMLLILLTIAMTIYHIYLVATAEI